MPCDYNKYHPEWKTKIRPDILERANNSCEICGLKNYTAIFRGVWNKQPVFQTINGDLFKEDGTFIMHNSEYEIIEGKNKNGKAIKVVLTIAHLDHDINNNNYSNLKALCQIHHLRHDIGHHKANREKNRGLQNLF